MSREDAVARRPTKRKQRRRQGRSGPIKEFFAQIFKVGPGDEPSKFSNDDETALDELNPDPADAVLQGEVSDWRVARSLDRLRDQVNAIAPSRSKASDGSIGDTSHQGRKSDHNPWVIDGSFGVVTARDITHDPNSGCDAQALADAIVASRDKRVKYIIWNKRIVSSSVQPWTWREYTGSNMHTKHIHISVLPDKQQYDDTKDWSV
jgi:hypothetical protein